VALVLDLEFYGVDFSLSLLLESPTKLDFFILIRINTHFYFSFTLKVTLYNMHP
jgi:hypothetical protein